MKLGIMQPYLFPYLGFFQLIDAVDKFVLYDDVNFIKGGWINRNRILVNNNPSLITLSLEKKSPNKKINEVTILPEGSQNNKHKLFSQIENAYRNAPNYTKIMTFLRPLIVNNESNLSKYIANTIVSISTYLDIDTEIILSSDIDKDNNLKGEQKVISICNILGASTYINLIGGTHLYHQENFRKYSISLNFLKMNDVVYNQYQIPFIPSLSIIDVMMFNSKKQIKEMLQEYTLY